MIATFFSHSIAIILYAISISYIIYAISQTNLSESIEVTRDFISHLWIFVVLFSAIFMAYLLLKQEEKETYKIEKPLLHFIIVLTSSMIGIQRGNIRLISFAKNDAKNYEVITLANLLMK